MSFILLGDLLRDDSIKTVQNLRENKFKINILSGDRKQTVLALAKKNWFWRNRSEMGSSSWNEAKDYRKFKN